MTDAAGPAPTLIGRIRRAWLSPAASWAEEWAAAPGEGRLVALAYGAALFLTLGRLLDGPGASDGLPWVAATVFIGFSFGVLALYGVAALIRLIARAFGGKGGWAATRLALFWSGLAAGPAMLLIEALGAAAGAGQVAGWAAGLVWAALLAPMLAAAHGFTLKWTVLVFAGFALAALILTRL